MKPTTPPDSEQKNDGNNNIKWYDRRLLIPSLVIFLLLSLLLYGMAMRHKPPEGYVFPREPAINGVYKCCEAGGRYSASWVGSVKVNCRGFGFYEFLGTNRNDCDLTQLNGQMVGVTRAHLPSFGARDPIGVRITSHGYTYYDVSDKRIRDLWIFSSVTDSLILAFILTVILHGTNQIYLIYFHKPANRKGEQ